MKVLSFGEMLLRLASPGYTRLFQENKLITSFCGAEANVAVSLAMFGLDSGFITIVPDNDIGQAAINSLRYFGVDTKPVIYGNGRMGLYYIEKGASQRATKVIYDRKYSAMAMAAKEVFNWDMILEGYNWFHWSGINPAISEQMIDICQIACETARKKGIMISCDLNYRENLWSSSKAQTVMNKLMPYVDVCIANEEDADKSLGIQTIDTDVSKGNLSRQGYEEVAKKICELYGCKYVATTLRESYSASDNGWSGMLYSNLENKTAFSRKYDIHLVDRVGGGDSFSAGLIYGIINKMGMENSLEFATAASCLKQTMEGDFNRTSVNEVMKLISGGGNGRVQR